MDRLANIHPAIWLNIAINVVFLAMNAAFLANGIGTTAVGAFCAGWHAGLLFMWSLIAWFDSDWA